ncbi:MAG: hypothetical protein QGM50_00110 [Anaerolineae bacterium]|nr:hypothetical protein [Anaerolineae bacterium]MDK1080423.1 hypothetical protein [Anaerolineae bacterium]MDK1117169.1 hypothetical protein [Anaerolineae bacterium]
MIDIFVAIILAAVPVLLLIKAIQVWRISKNNWFILPISIYLFAVITIFTDWWSGLLVVLIGLISYVVIGKATKK